MLSVGIVGSGQSAAYHLDCYEQLATTEVSGVVPTTPGDLSHLPSTDIVPRYESLSELMRHEDNEVVDVCDPAFPRERLINGVAGTETAVLAPHPFELDVPGLRDLNAELTAGGGVLLLKQPYRHHPGLQRIRQDIQRGAIGSIGTARFHRRTDSIDTEDDMGTSSMLADPGAIYFDCLEWLIGDIDHVYARRSEVGDGREEVTNTIVRFVSGSVAHLELTLLTHASEREFLEVRGTGGGIDFEIGTDHGLSTTTMARSGPPPTARLAGGPERSTDPVFRELDRLMSHIRDVGLEPDESVFAVSDAERSLWASGAALRSAENDTPVAITEVSP